VTLSLSSCPPSRRTRHGKRQQPTRTSHSIMSNPIEAGERLLSTRYCRACLSLSMLFAMVLSRVLLPTFSRSCPLLPFSYLNKNLTEHNQDMHTQTTILIFRPAGSLDSYIVLKALQISSSTCFL